ncbi:MAG: hypothetical protein ACOYNC_18335 [Bacteroidales bacterium]
MKKYLIIPVALLLSTLLGAQGLYINGGKINISSGATLYVEGTAGNLLNATNGASDGSIALNGTLKVDGNYTNNVSSADVLGTVGASSQVAFTGTTAQTLGGSTSAPFVFNDLVVNNAAGVSLSKSATVNGALTLTSGLVTLGSNDLTLGTAATVSGTPSASNMIVASGSGILKKKVNATGSFTFPVGDNTVTAEYSPVTLNFTAGTFAAGAYAGVNLVNSKYPDAQITGSYLNRYWNISQSGITSYTCTAVFQYKTADVNGTEAEIYALRVDPTPFTPFSAANTTLHQLTASDLTSFGTFTGGPNSKSFDLTVFLEGPYAGAGTMNTTLQENTLVPLAQPYNVAPWNYTGTEAVASVPAGVVDWVLIELRDAVSPDLATPDTKLAGWPKAYFLKSNGAIVDLDGTSMPKIGYPAVAHNLYIVVRHRNHLAVISNSGMSLASNAYSYNFSTAITQAYGGADGYKQIGTDVFGMVSSDADADGEISVLDYTKWVSEFGNFPVYMNSDFDMDGEISVLDYTRWVTNFGVAHPILGTKTVIPYESRVPGQKY